MRRLLVVSPHFPPVNAPDMQRVRQSLPWFVEAGWEVTALTVADPTPTAPLEPELLETVPAGVRVVRARCLSRRWTRWLGLGNVALRSLPFLFRQGCRLLSSRRYDAVYFSTTMFVVLPFGRIWRRLYGVPYVIDLQDPWVTDYYARPGAPRPPGGWKYHLARGLGQWLEGWTMRRVSHLITVSASHAEELKQRHPHLRTLPCTVLPFGSPDLDLERLRATLPERPPLLPPGGFRLVFAGALGPGMLGGVEVLLAAVASLRRRARLISVHFYGTSYAGTGEARPVIRELIARHGVADCVHEQPERLPYAQALQVTLEADANLLLGSADPGFVPSKLLTVLAAGRPVLALATAGSALAGRLTALGLPYVPLPASAGDQAAISRLVELLESGMASRLAPPPPPPQEFTAKAVAGVQMEILAAAAGSGS